ncbi:Serine-type D-Ala-D-Ala carboxypeptidase [Alkaliphilus oremlandii OhILAs]|uniref:serine-type D-Ala-D-Ala carboxypeptidase n=2 Tax=Alkaliphilus oremlandii TaxID=461876 RepID=A8MFG0_ALKOO|nr:Serine-type D-Ala-D-Ala carboxypeptidase [Alkaliphilus oremlandii OhILAs]
MRERVFCFIIIFMMLMANPSYGQEKMKNIQTGGKSAIVMDVETGRILYEKNMHLKLPMASTTKIMTALLAIENIPLEKRVKINQNAQGIEGSSIYLRANEEVKAIDLVYGLMLRSGNDAAAAIAYEVSGSIEAFADLMNERANKIGAKNTNFTNPHGLHHENHYTTAYDLALITREALKNSVFKEVVKTKFWTADRNEYKHFANKNIGLEICEGGDGVKTGYTTRSGRCLVSSASREGMQFISITLDDYNWFDTNKKLLDEGFKRYRPHHIFTEEQVITSMKVLNGKKNTVFIKPNRGLIVPLSEGELERLLTVINAPDTLEAPLEKGSKIGTMVTYLDGKILGTTDLIIDESVERITIREKIKNLFIKQN